MQEIENIQLPGENESIVNGVKTVMQKEVVYQKRIVAKSDINKPESSIAGAKRKVKIDVSYTRLFSDFIANVEAILGQVY